MDTQKNIFEKAKDAPHSLKILFGSLKMRLESSCPDLLLRPNWEHFVVIATVGGCVSLAIRLHFDIKEEKNRTELELELRKELKECFFSDTEQVYKNCYDFATEKLRDIPRPDRGKYFFPLIALWVLQASTGSGLDNEEQLNAQIASIYQNETIGFWDSKILSNNSDQNGLTPLFEKQREKQFPMFIYKDEHRTSFKKWACILQWLGSLVAVSNFFLRDGFKLKVFFAGVVIFLIGWIFEVIGRANVIFWIKVKKHPDVAYNWFTKNEAWMVIESQLPVNYKEKFPKKIWIGPFRLCVPSLGGSIVYIFGLNEQYRNTIPDFFKVVQAIKN